VNFGSRGVTGAAAHVRAEGRSTGPGGPAPAERVGGHWQLAAARKAVWWDLRLGSLQTHLLICLTTRVVIKNKLSKICSSLDHSERTFNISQHLAKLCARKQWHLLESQQPTACFMHYLFSLTMANYTTD